MNKIFNFKRFASFFSYDLLSSKNNAGLTLAIVGAMPVFTFACYEIFPLLLKGQMTPMTAGGKIMAFIVAIGIITLFFPERQYGQLTDKKSGSNWLLIPASSTEKWLSMLLVTCLVVPALLFAELFATDALLSLIFKGTYGESALSIISAGMSRLWISELQVEGAGGIAISWPYAFYLSFCQNILFFTLGSIYFKKAKIGKTFLAGFLICMILTVLTIAVMKAFGSTDLSFGPEDLSDAAAVRAINTVIYLVYVLLFAALDVLLFLRIKNLKH